MEENEIKKNLNRKRLPVKFIIPDELPTFYASEMLIQNQHTEFILSFFEVRPHVQPPPTGKKSDTDFDRFRAANRCLRC